MRFKEFLEEVHKERPDASVFLVRVLCKDNNIGVVAEDGLRDFTEADVVRIADLLIDGMLPKGRRFENMPEMAPLRKASYLLHYSYAQFLRKVKEGRMPSVKIGNRYFLTKEMVGWIHRRHGGAVSERDYAWVAEKSKKYLSTEDYRRGLEV